MDIEVEAERVQTFIEEGNYHAAFNIALSALNECRRNSNQPCVDRFLDIIKGVFLAMEKEFGSK